MVPRMLPMTLESHMSCDSCFKELINIQIIVEKTRLPNVLVYGNTPYEGTYEELQGDENTYVTLRTYHVEKKTLIPYERTNAWRNAKEIITNSTLKTYQHTDKLD